MNWIEGDLSGLLLPRDLAVLRDEARSALDAGRDLSELYAALATSEPLALADLVLGPKALAGPAAVDSALCVIEAVEAGATPAAVYRRLLDLAPERADALLDAATRRHPAAGWLVALSEKIDQPVGLRHLRASLDHPAFASICTAYAARGHVDALVELGDTARPELLAALAVKGHDEAFVRAAARALEADPTCPIVPFVCAARGPSARALIRRLLPRLRSRLAAERLQLDLSPFPEEQKLLALLSAGMRPDVGLPR